MKYSVFMPYINRGYQLWNTLTSYVHYYGNRNDVEVIIVEDVKNKELPGKHEELLNIISHYGSQLTIRFFETNWPDVKNPAPYYNFCAEQAKGEFFVITNPECFHLDNVLGGFDEEFAKDRSVYVLAACFDTQLAKEKGKPISEDLEQWVNSFNDFVYENRRWRVHSKHNKSFYHFCSALSRETWAKVGGFCDEYRYAPAAEDDDFRDNMAFMQVQFVICDDLVVVHQSHNRPGGSKARNVGIYKRRRQERREQLRKEGKDEKIEFRVR